MPTRDADERPRSRFTLGSRTDACPRLRCFAARQAAEGIEGAYAGNRAASEQRGRVIPFPPSTGRAGQRAVLAYLARYPARGPRARASTARSGATVCQRSLIIATDHSPSGHGENSGGLDPWTVRWDRGCSHRGDRSLANLSRPAVDRGTPSCASSRCTSGRPDRWTHRWRLSVSEGVGLRACRGTSTVNIRAPAQSRCTLNRRRPRRAKQVCLEPDHRVGVKRRGSVPANSKDPGPLPDRRTVVLVARTDGRRSSVRVAGLRTVLVGPRRSLPKVLRRQTRRLRGRGWLPSCA